jgi:hypothetical protein
MFALKSQLTLGIKEVAAWDASAVTFWQRT